MDSKLYIERAQNEMQLAHMIFKLSNEPVLQEELLDVGQPQTHYSAVIAHAYYAIFYSAKAYLAKKNIKTEAPEEHRKTYEAFKALVDRGEIDVALLKIYKEVLVKADSLLLIFFKEKRKRGDFTYHKLPQANEAPAKESLANANVFYKHLVALTE